MCTLDLNGPTHARRHDECSMVKQTCEERTQKDRLKSEGLAVLSSLKASHEISFRVLERQLRKLKGVKEIIINPISRTIKIRYDPRVVSVDKMRSILKNT